MFTLTPQERQVILFLTTVALIGMGANFLLKNYSGVRAIACFSENIGKVNLNTADKDLLMALPGIGEKLAQRIIDYRREQEGFGDLEELKNIKGMTNYRFQKIKNSLILKK